MTNEEVKQRELREDSNCKCARAPFVLLVEIRVSD